MDRHRWRLSATFLFALVSLGGTVRAATPQQVDRAIKRGIEWLYSKQPWSGNPGAVHQEGGLACIATYALLAAGESPQDARMKSAIELVKGLELEGTYAIAMRAQMYPFLSRQGNVDFIRRDALLLAQRMRKIEDFKTKEAREHGESDGLFRYNQEGDDYDHSCSNYGVLGMWAIQQTNFEIPDWFWQKSERGWLRHQHDDGGWSYQGGGSDSADLGADAAKASMSMTSAAVATLFITQDYLHGMEGLRCKGNITNPAIEAGLRWMSQHMDKIGDHWPFYTWYNIERVGTASGYKYFGAVDWYQKGAQFIVSRQGDDGSWGNIPDTCFAILFLSRGRAPIMMNKLQYVVDTRGDKKPMLGAWNQRPRDVANLTHYTGRQIEKYLNWQIVNFKVDVSELHDAPILYISGNELLRFTPEEEAKLKQYVEEGGLVLGNSDCATMAFTASFKKLGTKLFGGEFRELPAGHPIYTNQQYRRDHWRSKPRIEALSNGARELMILFPTHDPAQGWQTRSFLGPEREPLAQAASDIFLYAVDKQNLRSKGETYIVHPRPKVNVDKTIKVARLKYGGNWDPEPGGWRRLDAVMQNDRQTKLDVQMVDLASGKLDSSFAVAHLTGTARATLSPVYQEKIRKYVEGGGTLVVDSCGGGGEFALSAEQVIAHLFPKAKLAILPIAHKVFSSGYEIKEVDYRPFARKTLGNIHTPRLRGLEINGRVAVFFSAEDLSVGLVGMPVDGINGYVPYGPKLEAAIAKPRMGATEIMANILLYAAK